MTTDPRALDEHAPAAGTEEPEQLAERDQPDAAVEPRNPPAAPPRRGRARRLAVAVAVVLLLAAAGLLAWRSWTAAQDERAGREAVEVAEKALPDVLSYDFADLDDDIARARGRLTDAFAAEYDELAAKTIRPTAEQYKAVVSAEVLASSLESADRDEASVLLFANQTTVTTELPAPRVDQSRVRMRLEHTASGWKVAAIEPL